MAEKKAFLIGALVGGAIGATTALLLAPTSGKELRSGLSDGVTSAIDKTEEALHQAWEASQHAVSAVTGRTQEIGKQIGEQTLELAGKVRSAVAAVAGSDTGNKAADPIAVISATGPTTDDWAI